jgi:hypothetical protein
MKQRFRLKRLLVLGIVLVLPMLASAQGSKANRPSQQAAYPTLTNSGDRAADLKKFEAEVAKWKKAEQERNAGKAKVVTSTASKSSSKTSTADKLNKAGHREIKRVDIQGFPSFYATGNHEADEKAYQEAKARWMTANPGVYEKYLKDNRITNRTLSRPKSTKP